MYARLTLGAAAVLAVAIGHSVSTAAKSTSVAKAAESTSVAKAAESGEMITLPIGLFTRQPLSGNWYDEAETEGLEELFIFRESLHYDTLPTSPNWGPFDAADETELQSNLDTHIGAVDWFFSDFEDIIVGGRAKYDPHPDEPDDEELDNMEAYTFDYMTAIRDWADNWTGGGGVAFGAYNFPTAGAIRTPEYFEDTDWIGRNERMIDAVDFNADFITLKMFPGGPDNEGFDEGIDEGPWMEAYIDAVLDWNLHIPIFCHFFPVYNDTTAEEYYLLDPDYAKDMIDVMWNYRSEGVRVVLFADHTKAQATQSQHDNLYTGLAEYIASLSW